MFRCKWRKIYNWRVWRKHSSQSRRLSWVVPYESTFGSLQNSLTKGNGRKHWDPRWSNQWFYWLRDNIHIHDFSIKRVRRFNFSSIDQAITNLCWSGEYECLGTWVEKYCWRFNHQKDGKVLSLKEHFATFPVLYFIHGSYGALWWYPSEYFFVEKPGVHCLAIDPFGSSNEMIIGGSMMRQNNFIFDIETKRVGIVWSRCSEDPNMIIGHHEMTGAAWSKFSFLLLLTIQ